MFAIPKSSVTFPSVLLEVFFWLGLKSNSILTSVMSALHMSLFPRALKFEAVRNKLVSFFLFLPH